MQLTTREKILILFLACFLTGALMYVFFLGPQIEKRSENKLLYDTLKEQKSQAEETIATAEESKNQIIKLQEQVTQLYNLMTQTKSYDVSLLLSEMLGKHNLMPLSLELSDYEDATPPEFSDEEYQKKFAEYADQHSKSFNGLDQVEEGDSKDTSDESGESSSEEKESAPSYALKRTATLRFAGNPANVNAFVDELTNYNMSYIISGYSLSMGNMERVNEVRLVMYEFVKPDEWQNVQEGASQ